MPSSSLFDSGRIRKRKVRRKEGIHYGLKRFLPITMWDLLVYFILTIFAVLSDFKTM